MRRLAPALVLSSAAVLLFSCGDDEKGLYGSQCDILDCHFDRIECQLYSPPNDAIIIHYLIQLEEGQEWTAKIVIETDGVEKISGSRFENDEFLQRVRLQRPGSPEQWPDFTGNFCEIKSGGDTAGKDMAGKCAFAFTNGYFLTAEFSCTLEAVD
jgi:hypothetical protein